MLVQASPVCRTERQQSHLKGTSSQSTMNHVVTCRLCNTSSFCVAWFCVCGMWSRLQLAVKRAMAALCLNCSI
ncbi:hypothetical protein PI124_g8711 [Phytophthora idaei]|nr:hypothetical protein PI124_g8711 [Phytophthora idaei]